MNHSPNQRDPPTRLDRAVASSRALGLVHRVSGDRKGDDATRASVSSHVTSRARAASTSVRTIVTRSLLYRWFTAEPEPDVIVIDLRQTRTVGPVISLLDRAVGPLVPATRTSSTARVARTLMRAFAMAPVRHAGVALATASTIALLVGSLSGLLSATGAVTLLIVAVLGLAGATEGRSLAEIQETRPYELLAAAFEPPEPPKMDVSDRSPTEARSATENSLEEP